MGYENFRFCRKGNTMTKKQSNTQAKPSVPSAGALRAAVALNEDGRWDEQVMAEIIDHETGVAKLLKAAEKAFDYLQGVRSGNVWEESDIVERLNQAISKATGGKS